jgi:AcrR family transcriptional regulator
MGRPKGTRSPNYEQRRVDLAQKVFESIQEDGTLSLRAMADRTGVSRPTLRHYFGSREGAVQAALESAALLRQRSQKNLAELPLRDAEATLREGLTLVVKAWRERGVGDLHAVGLRAGLEDERSGHTYLVDVLEPLLGSVERLLERLIDANTLLPHDPRQGALALVSPVMMVLLHQDGLGGADVRPLAVDGVIRSVVNAWCRAHGTEASEPAEASAAVGQ